MDLWKQNFFQNNLRLQNANRSFQPRVEMYAAASSSRAPESSSVSNFSIREKQIGMGASFLLVKEPQKSGFNLVADVCYDSPFFSLQSTFFCTISECIRRMLRLNATTDASGFHQDVWKVLIYDQFCRDLISPLMNVKDLRSEGVTLHMYANGIYHHFKWSGLRTIIF